jgi:hypothetical protein
MQPHCPFVRSKCPYKLNVQRVIRKNIDQNIFRWTMLYRALDIEMSSQNLVSKPLPTLKQPLEKKSSRTLNKPFQQGESKGFGCTCVIYLECRYLFRIGCFQTPSSFKIFKIHLLKTHLLFSSSN